MKKLILSAIMAAAGALGATAAVPAGYYQRAEGKCGQALLSALYDIVGTHVTVSYDNLGEVYKTSDVYPDGTLWDIYSTKHWPQSQKCGNYSRVGDCWNKEHSFPKSWFSKASPMYSDAYHLYPTDGKVNGQRSNFPYGECSGGTTLASDNGVTPLGRLGTSTFAGYSGKVFEPDDQYKGDLARSYFYMAAAYNNRIASWSSDMLGGNAYPAYTPWAVQLLLKWHNQDPVSDKELTRNDAIAAWQQNRNPFIDYPELVDHIWGAKSAEPWYAGGSPEPVINTPVNGTNLNFGTTGVNMPASRVLAVRGSHLESDIRIFTDNSDFAVSTSTIPAATANAGTASVTLTFKRPTAGTSSGTLVLNCGGISTRVALRATAVDGIPALPPTNVHEYGFTANWISLGDHDNYTIDITDAAGQSIDGYPRTVTADAEEHPVDNLDHSSLYRYTLTSPSKASNTVEVVTLTPIPSAVITNGDGIDLTARPGEPSDAVELWIEVENIDEALRVAVDAPFELSTDHLNWSGSIILQPVEERFYLRVNPTEAGDYETSITITAGTYVNDDTEARAFVTDNTAPWFNETWESITADTSGYINNQNVTGTAATWLLNDCGFWKADGAHTGNYAIRLGKSATSSLQTTAPKRGGIGTVTFHANRWSASDGDVTIALEHSADNGATWQSAGTATVNADEYRPYTLTVNTPGDNIIRLRQTAGKRGNIDDITVTDYTSAVTAVETDGSDWDAYSLCGNLVIDNRGNARQFIVYTLDGKTELDVRLGATARSFALPAGLYIISDGENGRRVLVK